ncbi:MAG: GntR family transcriptional regulator [Desulfobacterales bacterium]|jgi:DNA-binding GntR family transcriptional regulator
MRLEFKRETLVDQISNILEQRILKGELGPTSKLSESMVAKEFGVSRIPAREALQRLEEKNLVRMTHSGRVVNQFSIDEFREIYELKNVVEAFGAMLGSQSATSSEMDRIREVVDRMREQFQSGDFHMLELTNYKFHDLLVSFARNDKVTDSFNKLVSQIRWATSKSFRMPDRPARSLEEHIAIFDAYRKRQGTKVRKLLEIHSQNNLQRVVAFFKEWLR